MRICKTCGIEKEDSEFGLSKGKDKCSNISYARNSCKKCCNDKIWTTKKDKMKIDPIFKKQYSDKMKNRRPKEYLRKRHNKRKEELIQYMGGKCQQCGYDKCIAAMEFHHKDPSTKSFDICSHMSNSKESIIKELDKCIMLCSNCHMELHFNQREH